MKERPFQSAAVTTEDHARIMAIKEKRKIKSVSETVHYILGIFDACGGD